MCNRIMIIDDSITARMMIRRCLEIAGYEDAEYYEASNGAEALDQLKEKKTDIIFTDLNMPEMDGEHFLIHMRKSPKFNKIPVVVISSKSNNFDDAFLIENGAAAVVNKPITPTILANIMESLWINI